MKKWWFGKADEAAQKALADAQARIAELKMDVRRREELLEVRDRTIEGLKADLEGLKADLEETEKEMRKYREEAEYAWVNGPQALVGKALLEIEDAALYLGLEDNLLCRIDGEAEDGDDVDERIAYREWSFDFDADFDGKDGLRNHATCDLYNAAHHLTLALGNERASKLLARSEEDVRIRRLVVADRRRKAAPAETTGTAGTAGTGCGEAGEVA